LKWPQRYQQQRRKKQDSNYPALALHFRYLIRATILSKLETRSTIHRALRRRHTTFSHAKTRYARAPEIARDPKLSNPLRERSNLD
jgi:hypothetical protein